MKIQDSANDNVRSALEELRTYLLSKYGQHAPQVMVYGSYARGDENPESDVDVLLVYPSEEEIVSLYELGSILSRLNLKYQVLISIMPVHKHQYETDSEMFWKNVRRDRILIDNL